MRKERASKSTKNFMEENRVFLDASVIIAALLSPGGGSFYVISSLKNEYAFVINEYVFEEVNRVLETKFHYSDLKNYFLMLLGSSGVSILSNPPRQSLNRLKGILSEEDRPILLGAVDAGCSFLLTLDDEFFNPPVVSFAQRHKLRILKPGDFINLYREG